MDNTRSSTMIRRVGDASRSEGDLYHAMCALTNDYGQELNEIITEIGRASTQRLVKRTRETAPVGNRYGKKGSLLKRRFNEGRPHLFESISMMRVRTVYGRPAWLWYVRAPNSRIAHIVEHGYHRVDYDYSYSGSHFLREAVKYEEIRYFDDVEQALGEHGYEIRMKYAKNKNLAYKHMVVKLNG